MANIFRSFLNTIIVGFTIAMSSPCVLADTFDYSQYVYPLIGSGGHGHVFVGASVPFGMVQVGPTSIPQDWDWCSGYHESDSTVIGFSHTHLSGTGIGDLFDITVMPVVGDVTYARGKASDPQSGLWSYADRSTQVVQPGYYRVNLLRYDIDAEMSATERSAIHRYTYPEGAEKSVVFDLQNGGCWDHPVATKLIQTDERSVEGYRRSSGWAPDQAVYFTAQFSQPIKGIEKGGRDEMYTRIYFGSESNEPLLMKVAISPVSTVGAKANLEAEIPAWDFDNVRLRAHESWNQQLGRINASMFSPDDLTIFYTCLYHTMIAPYIFCDVDNQYRRADGSIATADGFTPYTVLSLWDTYRAALPLLSIFQPYRYADVVNTMVDISEAQGRMPVWHLWGNETYCMVGNPGAIAVADAVAKRTRGVNGKRALRQLLLTADDTIRGIDVRNRYGYLPVDIMREALAHDLEYAIADAATAAAADSLGETAVADRMRARSKSYRQFFDPKTRFMRGRLSDGSWRTPFDPFSATHEGDDYCEGNAWQYTWLVPCDIDGLAQCFSSKEAMIEKLDSLFVVDSSLTGKPSPDISGLIGQYAHGNEPSHHIPYIYSMLGQPQATADLVRRILAEMYTDAPDGLCGNEDAGQMSAWYIMSALGLYEVEPGSARYWFGSPIVTYAEIKVRDGVFTIRAENNSPDNKYIKLVRLNGADYTLPYILHSDIEKGGELVFVME